MTNKWREHFSRWSKGFCCSNFMAFLPYSSFIKYLGSPIHYIKSPSPPFQVTGFVEVTTDTLEAAVVKYGAVMTCMDWPDSSSKFIIWKPRWVLSLSQFSLAKGEWSTPPPTQVILAIWGTMKLVTCSKERATKRAILMVVTMLLSSLGGSFI